MKLKLVPILKMLAVTVSVAISIYYIHTMLLARYGIDAQYPFRGASCDRLSSLFHGILNHNDYQGVGAVFIIDLSSLFLLPS